MGSSNNGGQSLKYTRSLRGGFKASFFKKNSFANNRMTQILKHKKATNNKRYLNFKRKKINYSPIDRKRNRKVMLEMIFVFTISSILVAFSLYYFNNLKFHKSYRIIEEPISGKYFNKFSGYADTLKLANEFYDKGNYDIALLKFESLGNKWRPSYNALLGKTKCYIQKCVKEESDCTIAIEYYNVLHSSGLLSKSQSQYLDSIWDNH